MAHIGDRRGIYNGDREWREETGFSWFPEKTFQSTKWQSFHADGSFYKLVRKTSERVSEHPIENWELGAATAVYVADRYPTPSNQAESTQVIVKIHMRIPNIPIKEGNEYVSTKDLYSYHLPIAEEDPDEAVGHYQNEVKILQYLTHHKCSYSPFLISTCRHDTYNPWVKNGFIGFIIMEKLSAVTVADIWDYKPSSEAQVREQLRIQEAFKITWVTMANLGIAYMDETARNLMWSSKAGNCYLVDFEMAGISRLILGQTWEELIATDQSPFSTFSKWGIIMDDQHKMLWEAIYPNNSCR